MDAWVLDLSETGRGDLDRVGGKGANLGELLKAGLPVPPGFCVTTTAWRAFRSAIPEALFTPLQDEALSSESVAPLADRLRAAVRAEAIPMEIEAAIPGAVHEAWAYAVRSSATAEDLPDASFAGQQDTYLNVGGREAVLSAVRDCWASLFSDRAILYRLKAGIPHARAEMSVVVQRMAQADAAGILFTADPISGHRNRICIDAGFGLGEAFVSGHVSADFYRVDKATGAVLEEKIADKHAAVRSGADGGIETVALSADQRKARVLDARALGQLVTLAKKIETHFGQPMDVEWAIVGGEPFMLQARPITTLFPDMTDAPFDAKGTHVYLCMNHIQGMIDPMGEMTRSLIGRVNPFGKYGKVTDKTPYMSSAGGRIYHDMTGFLRVPWAAKWFPGAVAASDESMAKALAEVIERADFKAAIDETENAEMNRRLRLFWGSTIRSAISYVWKDAERSVQATRDATERRLEEIVRTWEGTPAGAERALAIHQTVGTLWGPIEPWLGPILASFAFIAVAKKLGATPDDVQRALRATPGNVVTEMEQALARVTELVLEDASLRAALEAHGFDGARGHPRSQDLTDRLRQFLDRFGMRAPAEVDIMRPRYHEEPGILLQAILASHADAERKAPDVLAQEALAFLATQPALRRWSLGKARALSSSREQPKFFAIRVLGHAKRLLLADARILVPQAIEDAGDIAHLSLDELIELHRRPSDQRARVSERKALLARWQKQFPPRILTSEGESVVAKFSTDGLPPGAFPGTAASSGVIEGVAHVIEDPTGERLLPGEILVARMTDPGWTPLFAHAAGLVMEVGGQMTHGSVIAREYGIPAVVCVADATTKLRTGARIRVNGSLGYVELLAEPGA